MEAEIIAVGSELLTSSHLETNSLFIAKELNKLGIQVIRKTVVGDREKDIARLLRTALEGSEVVIMTGGLGPTKDDITREVVAETLDRPLSLDENILAELRSCFSRADVIMTDNNQRQAMVPEGGTAIDNPNGTAPGLFLRKGKALIFLLPGPPREMQPMMRNSVTALIRKNKRTTHQLYRLLRVTSEAESSVDSRINPIYSPYTDIQTTILSSPGNIDLYFYWMGVSDRQLAESRLSELARQIQAELGDSVFTDQEEDLEEVVGEMLRDRELTLATAESCTGGMIGKMMTDLAGSSDYYLGGVVSYSDALKIEMLGVNKDTLSRFGAVSEEVAAEMATGILSRSGANIGVSVTGIAGPEGGTLEKPVGLVFVGLSDSCQTRVTKAKFAGPRDTIRLRTSRFVLDQIRRSLL